MSRPTLYRRYKDVTALATALLTRELLDILDTVPRMPSDTEELVDTIVIYTDKARNNKFLRAIIETDPELLTTYPSDASARAKSLSSATWKPSSNESRYQTWLAHTVKSRKQHSSSARTIPTSWQL
ncbi:MAG: hypothetical protein U1U88_001957 [Lawsonella clevelandensis]